MGGGDSGKNVPKDQVDDEQQKPDFPKDMLAVKDNQNTKRAGK